jgi:hypothetical protein
VTSNACLSPHRYISESTEVTATSQYKHVVTDRVKFQHFVAVLNIFFFKSRQWLSTTNVNISNKVSFNVSIGI